MLLPPDVLVDLILAVIAAAFSLVCGLAWCVWRIAVFFADVKAELKAIREEIKAERDDRKQHDEWIERRVEWLAQHRNDPPSETIQLNG